MHEVCILILGGRAEWLIRYAYTHTHTHTHTRQFLVPAMVLESNLVMHGGNVTCDKLLRKYLAV